MPADSPYGKGDAARDVEASDEAVRLGRLDPAAPTFVGHPALPAAPPIAAAVAEMEDLHDAAALFRSHPHFATPNA